MRLKDRKAIVTGAGSGIGRAISHIFAREGAHVVISDIDLASARKVASEVKDMGREALAIKADVRDENEVRAMVKETLRAFGRVDILVNNAGTFTMIPFPKMTKADFEGMLSIHAVGNFNCCRAVIEKMMEQKYGRIINISSTSGTTGDAEEDVHYCAAKAAIIGLSKALAKEMAPHGITVNVVAPGVIDTPIYKSVTKEMYDYFMGWTLVGRVGKPEDIAEACLYLALEEASFITGQIISPNGGIWI